MALSDKLRKRVQRELTKKFLTAGENVDGHRLEEIETSVERRIVELEGMLEEATVCSGEQDFSVEDIELLSAELAVAEVMDPEFVSVVEAIATGTFDFEEADQAFIDAFTEAFIEYWETHGLKRATIELVLAERQRHQFDNASA